MDPQKAVAVLNSLIEINNDRIDGYETASKETEETDLKTLFAHLSQTSETCKTDLVAEVRRMGGEPAEGTRLSGKFFRVWMDVKAALTSHDRKSILESCEYGENVASDTYKDVLLNDLSQISTEQYDMLHAQHLLLKADHDKIKGMHDELVKFNR